MFRVSRVTRPAAVHVTRLGHGSHPVFRTPRASMSMTAAAAAKVKVALGTIGWPLNYLLSTLSSLSHDEKVGVFTLAATVIGMGLNHYHHQTNEKREKAEQRALQLHRADEYYRYLSIQNEPCRFGLIMLSRAWDGEQHVIPTSLSALVTPERRTFTVNRTYISEYFKQLAHNDAPSIKGDAATNMDAYIHRMCLRHAVNVIARIELEFERKTLLEDDLPELRHYAREVNDLLKDHRDKPLAAVAQRLWTWSSRVLEADKARTPAP